MLAGTRSPNLDGQQTRLKHGPMAGPACATFQSDPIDQSPHSKVISEPVVATSGIFGITLPPLAAILLSMISLFSGIKRLPAMARVLEGEGAGDSAKR